MITDEKLRELIDKFNKSEAYAYEHTNEVLNALIELLSLRQQVAELKSKTYGIS